MDERLAFLQSYYSMCKVYVRDVDLHVRFYDMYNSETYLYEKKPIDMTPLMGGMTTTARYIILATPFDTTKASRMGYDNEWDMHVTKSEAYFKVLAIESTIDATNKERTMILLALIPEGVKHYFDEPHPMEEEIIETYRTQFNQSINDEAIVEVNEPKWLSRITSPIGVDDMGFLNRVEEE